MTTATNTANRERIARIIRELQARTVSNGCTEAEAMAAAEKLDELLREYDMSIDEASVAGDRYGARRRPYATGICANVWHPAVKLCALAIGRFTNTRPLMMINGDLMYFGTAQDTDAAFYLTDLIKNAGDGAWQAEVKRLRELKRDGGNGMGARTVRASWFLGYAIRVSERLNELTDARDRQTSEANTNTGLVLVKRNTVAERYRGWLRANNYRTKRSRSSGSVRSSDAFDKGRSAGDRVQFNKPVSGATSSPRIG